MNLTFKNKRVTGILTVVPAKEVRFEDEMGNYNFTREQSVKLQKIMGFGAHRIVDDGTCVSDLAVFGLNHLIQNGQLKKEEIDALIFVTQTPDFMMPATSFIVHGALGLRHDVYCLDINQGCAGYLVGLQQAFLLTEQANINKVVLVNADILSRKVNKRDRNSFPLIGDACSITLIEKGSGSEQPVYSTIKIDGGNSNVLTIPAGGMRLPSSAETAIEEQDEKGNIRSKDNLVMKGDAVYNFVMMEVPPMIADLHELAGKEISDTDYFLFHQPNKFMLQKLADKLKVPYAKMPFNVVEHFGNSSGVSIPTAITFNLAQELRSQEYTVCLAGFGVGLTWSSMLLKLGNLDFCEMINY